MNKKEALNTVDAEIAWCIHNPEPAGKTLEFKKGFVAGLRQAKRLLREMPGQERS